MHASTENTLFVFRNGSWHISPLVCSVRQTAANKVENMSKIRTSPADRSPASNCNSAHVRPKRGTCSQTPRYNMRAHAAKPKLPSAGSSHTSSHPELNSNTATLIHFCGIKTGRPSQSRLKSQDCPAKCTLSLSPHSLKSPTSTCILQY